MDCSWFNLSYQSIEIIESQEKLNQYEVQSYPHLDQTKRQKLHKETLSRGWPTSFVKKSVITLDDVAKIVGAKNG
jgi:hypothetical protein